MKLAIMQPYLFPYIGYYQLVNAADTFVFFDDVNFINKGWINRNQLLNQDQPFKFTVPLAGASQNKMINQIELSDFGKWRLNFLRSVEYNYKKAPHFSFVFSWLNDFFSKDYVFINDLASESIKAVSCLLNLPTVFNNSGSLQYKNEYVFNAEQKIISICKMLGVTIYINPKNGINLYNRQNFAAEKIQLSFINMDEIKYDQFNKNQFVPNLSIIDVLMFNSVEETVKLLNRFALN